MITYLMCDIYSQHLALAKLKPIIFCPNNAIQHQQSQYLAQVNEFC